MTPCLAATDAEIAACFPVMAQLRPHLQAEDFIARVREQQRSGGYLLAALRDPGGAVRACAGYRLLHQLAWGRVLYVDDLVTAAGQRSAGHGRVLLDWLAEQGRAAGCAALHLDSGTQRHDAHRFYFRERLTISSYHFIRPLR